MPGPDFTLFENIFTNSIANALRLSEDITQLEHAGLKGLVRESLIESVITPLLGCPRSRRRLFTRASAHVGRKEVTSIDESESRAERTVSWATRRSATPRRQTSLEGAT
jgi:hypothetical protein